MIENSLDKLTGEFKTKSKVLMEVCNSLKIRISPYETWRSATRQKWLVAQGKSWTLKSEYSKLLLVSLLGYDHTIVFISLEKCVDVCLSIRMESL
jgi:hypothetical protein